jgi:glycosyltransferase involved in cell wall biosynthesis
MKTLGACLIVKNEEKDIRNCLESIKECDEIVILDTGSTDNTVSICKEYTDQVFTDYKWEDDFSKARNEAMSRCSADWIIIIDADEKLITSVAKIRKIVSEFWFRKYFGMFFTVQMKFEVFESPRLFKNVPEILYINAAHNVPTWRGDANELVRRLYKSSFLIESGYSEAHKLDPDRTLRILLKNYEKRPDDTRTMYYLAREHLNRKDVKKATELFEKYRDLKFKECDRWDNELADVLYLLALCYSDKEAWGEARWFDAVQSALWSHCVLPHSKDTANFLKTCFGELPGSVDGAVRAQLDTVKFWEKAYSEATDAGVLMRRCPIC